MSEIENPEVKMPTPDEVKKQQVKLWAIGLGVLSLIAFGIYLVSGDNKNNPNQLSNERDATIYDVTGSVDDKNYWMYKNEGKLAEQQQTQEKILQEIDKIRGDLDKPQLNNNQFDSREDELLELRARVQAYENQQYQTEYQNDMYSESPKPSISRNQNKVIQNALPDQDYYDQNQIAASNSIQQPVLRPASGIFSENLALEPLSDEKNNSPHMDSYIPAGSFAKAVLLSGVDVSAGVSSQSNPKPVVLRLVDKGSLPNKAVGNMKECRVVAAAYGDLSSERAYMRLEKLSCIENDGHVIETDVDGYISGEDGKNGLRGNVVMRDGEVLKRGFVGGLFSGLGKATAQTFQTTSVSPLGVTSSVTGADTFAKAAADGVGDAFELMAKYNIQRAEQYQPVIQISAGRLVEIVFHSGSKFGEKKTREPAKKTGDIYAN